jgi:hypothetical protein
LSAAFIIAAVRHVCFGAADKSLRISFGPVISICFFARAKNSGRFFESAPNSSHEFINNGYPDTLSTKNKANQLHSPLKPHKNTKKTAHQSCRLKLLA